jgi:BlaI family penicillinase repressor
MKNLTKQEEEALKAVWKTKGGFIKNFLDQMESPIPPYTTLASTVKNLEKKGFLKSEKLGNSYRFTPLIGEEDYKKQYMNGIVNEYFENSYKELVAFFAKEEKLSPEDLKEIIYMIENKKS